MNAVSSLIGEREAISIRSKSINYSYLTISEETSSMLKLLMIGVFPLMYLGTVDADEQIIEIEQNTEGLREIFE